MIYNILLVAERCNLCCHGNSIEFIVPFIQNDFPDFISWWIIWLLLGVQSNCKKVSCYGKHKHWNRYFHIMEIQMNATYSFLASNMPSLCNDSVYVHEMDFLVWDGSGPKGGLFLAVEIGEVSGLPGYLALSVQDLTLRILSDMAAIQRCIEAQGNPTSVVLPRCSYWAVTGPLAGLNAVQGWGQNVQQLPTSRLKMAEIA